MALAQSALRAPTLPARTQRTAAPSRSASVCVRAQQQVEGGPSAAQAGAAVLTGKKSDKQPSPAVHVISPISRCDPAAGAGPCRPHAAAAAAGGRLAGTAAATLAAAAARRWSEGIPPAMGGHFMPSGAAAPLSQSKGPGIDIHPLMFTYPAGGGDVEVRVYDSDFAAASGLADYVAQVRCWRCCRGAVDASACANVCSNRVLLQGVAAAAEAARGCAAATGIAVASARVLTAPTRPPFRRRRRRRWRRAAPSPSRSREARW